MYKLMLLALSLAVIPSATAANCQDFNFTIKNATSDEIKVKKIEYLDQGTWRTEHALGIDGYKKLEPGKAETFNRNLERIGGEATRFRITYAHHNGGSQWEDDIVFESSSFTCNDKGSTTITLVQ